jgi:hypothetical protein
MNNALLFAQGFRGWGIGELAIAIIIVIAVIAVVFIFIRQSGVPIPPWVIQLFWIIVACLVCIGAIRFIMTM